MVSCPLLTLLTFLWPSHRRCSAKRGVRGLGSGRRFAYGWLSDPEVSLRSLPRITVRGHMVQDAHPVAANGSASIKREALEQQTHLWAPRF